jgi:hypothetical protein
MEVCSQLYFAAVLPSAEKTSNNIHFLLQAKGQFREIRLLFNYVKALALYGSGI